jgi:hypothetical protein
VKTIPAKETSLSLNTQHPLGMTPSEFNDLPDGALIILPQAPSSDSTKYYLKVGGGFAQPFIHL